MRNKLIICFTLVVLGMTTSFIKQPPEELSYLFPTIITNEIDGFCNKQKNKDPTTSFYSIIANIKDTVYVNVFECDMNGKDKLIELIKSTNRFIKTPKMKIPVIFKADLLYSDIALRVNTSGMIESVGFSGGGFHIHFYRDLKTGDKILSKGVKY